MAPLEDRNGKIYAPTDNAKVAMRKVITRQEAEQLIEEMPQIKELWVANEKQREMQDIIFPKKRADCSGKENHIFG